MFLAQRDRQMPTIRTSELFSALLSCLHDCQKGASACRLPASLELNNGHPTARQNEDGINLALDLEVVKLN